MANKTINDLTSGTTLAGSETVPIWQGGATVKVPASSFVPWYVADTVGDATTDDTAAVQAAIDATAGTNQPIYFKANPSLAQTYIKITGTIQFNNPFQSIYMDANTIFHWYGANDVPAIIIGDSGNFVFNRNTYHINAHNSVVNAATGVIGIQILGSHHACTYHLHSDGFNGTNGTGVQFNSASVANVGLAYNQVFLGFLYGCQIGVHIHEAQGSGFINQNIFYGGYFTGASGTSYGVLFSRAAAAYSLTQQNYFIAPSFEGCDYPVYFNDCGTENYFDQCRDEANGDNFFTVYDDGSSPKNNLAVLAYSDKGNSGTFTANISGSGGPRDGTPNSFNNIVTYLNDGDEVWDSGKLVDKAFVTATATSGGPATFLANSISMSGATVFASSIPAYSTSGNAYIGKDSLTLLSCSLGWMVDCTYFNDFEVYASYTTGGSAPVISLGFKDSSGAWLSGGDGYPFSNTSYIRTNLFGTGADGYATSGKFTVPPDTATMWMVVGGSAGLGSPVVNIKSIHLRAWSRCRAYPIRPYLQVSPIDIFMGNIFTSEASPAGLGSGYTSAGTIVGDTSGATKGWYCTLSGWNSRAWVASTIFYIDMLVTNGGNVYVCRTAGTSAGAGGPSGTGTGIADNTVVWDYVSGSVATWAAL